MPNAIYAANGSQITFKSSAGTVTFTPTSVATGAGRISARWDRGAGSLPARYKWRAVTKAGAALTVGNQMEIYLSTSDGTYADGNQSTSDAAFTSTDKRMNLQPVGAVVADSTSNGEVQVASGEVVIKDRYVSVVWWNLLGQSLSGTAGDHVFILQPVNDEVQ